MPGQRVLRRGEDAVADVLVQRHAPAPGRARVEHPRSEDGVALAVLEGGDDLVEDLGRVLAVAVQQDDDVEIVLDRPLVAGLLVAAVAEVAGLADDGQRQVGHQLLVAEPDEVGGVLAVVVADEDLRARAP